MLIAFMLMTQGCMKTWVADFTSDKTEGWNSYMSAMPGSNTTKDEGLFLSGIIAYPRWGFTGDKVIYEVYFDLDTDTTQVLDEISLYLGISVKPSEEGVKCRMVQIGGPSNVFYLYDNAEGKDAAGNIPGLLTNTLNVFRLTINQGTATFELNNTKLTGAEDGTFQIQNYMSDTFVPHIYVSQGSPDEGEELCWIRKVVVKYSGNKVGPFI